MLTNLAGVVNTFVRLTHMHTHRQVQPAPALKQKQVCSHDRFFRKTGNFVTKLAGTTSAGCRAITSPKH